MTRTFKTIPYTDQPHKVHQRIWYGTIEEGLQPALASIHEKLDDNAIILLVDGKEFSVRRALLKLDQRAQGKTHICRLDVWTLEFDERFCVTPNKMLPDGTMVVTMGSRINVRAVLASNTTEEEHK